jgi:hypothetical protein
MNKIFLILVFSFFINSLQAQVAIGKVTVDGSAILDFAQDIGGVILPFVRTLPTEAGATDGTILINGVDLAAVKVQVRINGSWQDISDASRDLTGLTLNTTTDIGNGVIIGSPTSSANGVLVLESNDKALVLPKVTNAETGVKSPIVGTMVYDLASKSLAIYDGVKWNFWK